MVISSGLRKHCPWHSIYINLSLLPLLKFDFVMRQGLFGINFSSYFIIDCKMKFDLKIKIFFSINIADFITKFDFVEISLLSEGLELPFYIDKKLLL